MRYQHQIKTNEECQAGCDLFAGYISSACIQDCKKQNKEPSRDESFEQNKQSLLLQRINFQE